MPTTSLLLILWLFLLYCNVQDAGAFPLPQHVSSNTNSANAPSNIIANGQSAPSFNLLKKPWLNKGTSFTKEERDEKNLHGLLPAGDPLSIEVKVETAMGQLRKKSNALEKYIFLHTIQDSDETLFYSILTKHTAETMPLVYTPTVGQACLEWSHIYRQQPRGLYLGLKDIGRIQSILSEYPNKDIKVIVVTDGERILGLGDLGSNGMGIPIGKLALYTACAGIHPSQCLPVMLDVGTNTESIRNDKAYIGTRQPRDRSEKYDELIGEFFLAAQTQFGRNVLVQFEDFGNTNAFRLLEHYRSRATTFNDDIQGTASVVLAGLIASKPLTKTKTLGEHRYLFYGAGEAGIGIADLLASAISRETGFSLEKAKSLCWFVDSKGLIHSARGGGKHSLEHHKQAYAHDLTAIGGDPSAISTSLLEAVKLVKPTALIGVSAQGNAFTQEIVNQMMQHSENPLIFALSNPTSKAECTAANAYSWTNGKAVFASGSPFDPVTLSNGKVFIPGQGNNAYIFPGVGLGAVVAKALEITDDDFLIAADTLAKYVTAERLASGCVYPDLKDIRDVSKLIAAAVAENIYNSGRSSITQCDSNKLPNTCEPLSLMHWIQECEKAMYHPTYNL